MSSPIILTISRSHSRSDRVTGVERCTPIMQLLKVEDNSMATSSNSRRQHKIMKIVTKVHFTASQIQREIAWFKDERTADGRCVSRYGLSLCLTSDSRRAQFLGSESDCFFVYLFFSSPGFTLRDLLDRETCQISTRHVREITAQMLKAAQCTLVHILFTPTLTKYQ